VRQFLLLAILVAVITGCARDPVSPPSDSDSQLQLKPQASAQEGPYRLWGEWTLYFDVSHENVDLVPVRNSRFHLNALKFLESYCSDCLKIVSLKNNGDSTVDLTVRITHPFPGLPQYTGFDVKGIIMFDGSWENPGSYYQPPWPEPFRLSWRKLGDPQLLNADGYTIRWSPWYESGSDLPIFNYWEGKYATGTPTANVNGYLNFYTNYNRHMFYTDGSVNRTYKIWLPPGEPVTCGYAVEACWEPPTVTPVTDPAWDFPITANQVEAYEFRFVLNNGEPITDPECCGEKNNHTEAYMLARRWNGEAVHEFGYYTDEYNVSGYYWELCEWEWPYMFCEHAFFAEMYDDGDYIGVATNYKGLPYPPWSLEVAYTVFEFTIDF
jgi:hypothetical protein